LRSDDLRKILDVSETTGTTSGSVKLDEVVGHLLLLLVIVPGKRNSLIDIDPDWSKSNLFF
jgi:hypothetical protein